MKGQDQVVSPPQDQAETESEAQAVDRSQLEHRLFEAEVLTTAIRGWTGYYRHAEMRNFVLETDAWLRSRLRMCIWKSWKRVKTRYRNLLRCGFEPWQARNASCARKGYWRVANSWIMTRAATTERLRQAGYPTLLEYYEKLHAHL